MGGRKGGRIENNNWGDFNTRTGKEGGRRGGEEEEEEGRRSKDKKINKEGRMLVEWIGERG